MFTKYAVAAYIKCIVYGCYMMHFLKQENRTGCADVTKLLKSQFSSVVIIGMYSLSL
jgi:hypothetical protein